MDATSSVELRFILMTHNTILRSLYSNLDMDPSLHVESLVSPVDEHTAACATAAHVRGH